MTDKGEHSGSRSTPVERSRRDDTSSPAPSVSAGAEQENRTAAAAVTSTSDNSADAAFSVVGIGASAGGIEAMIQFFE
ncbi:MAG TPA: hypothetical protein VLQ65_11865, partial [Saliniramus sp.]|nr:hypothetical protein [Saliniramus sp.]